MLTGKSSDNINDIQCTENNNYLFSYIVALHFNLQSGNSSTQHNITKKKNITQSITSELIEFS